MAIKRHHRTAAYTQKFFGIGVDLLNFYAVGFDLLNFRAIGVN